MAHLVQNCSDPDIKYLVSEEDFPDLPTVFRDVFTQDCYEIVGRNGLFDPLVLGDIECFQTCEECLKTVYKLTDCRGNKEDVFVSDPIFGTVLGDIVRVPYFDNTCFRVSSVLQSKTQKVYPTLEVNGLYKNCVACYPKKHSEPIDLVNCDPEKVSKVSCLFADEVYKQMVTRRLDVATSTKKNYNYAIMKFENLLGDLKYEEDPDLPEPNVDLCCIETRETLCEPVPNCLPCQEATLEENECNCYTNAGPNHVCRTFLLGVTQGVLDEAIGNTDTTLNNKVFFGYYPCEKHQVVTKIFKTPEEIEVCVLGNPIYGYYRDNEWQNLVITSSVVCKEKQNNCLP
jgi:hypothetical protein